LAAIKFDDQAPLTANEVDVVAAHWFLANGFEAAELATTNACPQQEFRSC
jgi:hypothetical protein